MKGDDSKMYQLTIYIVLHFTENQGLVTLNRHCSVSRHLTEWRVSRISKSYGGDISSCSCGIRVALGSNEWAKNNSHILPQPERNPLKLLPTAHHARVCAHAHTTRIPILPYKHSQSLSLIYRCRTTNYKSGFTWHSGVIKGNFKGSRWREQRREGG